MTVQDLTTFVEDAIEAARAPDPEYDPFTVQDLVDLWHADELSEGFPHPFLARAVCRIMRPAPERFDLLCQRFYPDASQESGVPFRALQKLRLGFDGWQRERMNG